MLVLEILAGRLMAPYLGVTLETFTGIIGTVLAGISLGAWWGGRLADRRNPAPFVGGAFIAGGVLALLAPPLVHLLGPAMRSGGPVEIVTLTAVAFFLPAVCLSAVTPLVVKIQLLSLDDTGTVVGSLSAVGTAGAIFGTFVTGFVLLATVPSRVIVTAVGIALVVAGIALLARRESIASVAALVAIAVAATATLHLVDGPCERETTYYCAFVTADPDRDTGRVLWLDTLRHSYVDIADPTHLGFRYAREVADVIGLVDPGGIDMLSIGGGGFTLPRYVAATRPGSTNVVLELDASLVDLVSERLGLDVDDPSLTVLTGDARTLLRAQPAGAFDVVVGDAFGGLSVPWHLTTREFVADIQERLRPDGIYVLNLIDYPPLGFARAEAATIAEVFAHVAVIAPADYLTGRRGGNFVIAASDQPIDADTLTATMRSRGGQEAVLTGEAAAAWYAGATLLTDDFAPVDQLLSRPSG